MPSVFIIMGVSGSGKTTVGEGLAAATGGRFFDADHYHSDENVEKMREGIPLTDDDRAGWLATLRALLAERCQAPEPTFLACSALKKAYRETLREGAPEARFIFLDGPEDVLRARMASREDHYMPAGLLTSQIEALEAPEDALRVDVSDPPETIIQRLLEALGLAK